ncbi:ABC transporter permease [Parabacteroides sp. OttesenSCG-928-J18]|nr:ABC transporter permease [Parabacteroides sp. OttesenSCG-928-J18]
MKRICNLIKSDIKFQNKYGFHMLYLFFSLVYIGVLYVLPENWRESASSLIIFSDPAMLGLIFIGAIVLFEKSERVLNSIAVSPVKISEYIISKAISLALISTICGLLIAFLSGMKIANYLLFICGLFFGASLFTCMGLVLGTRISTLNKFMITITPLIIIITLPVVVYQFWSSHPLWLLHPGCAVFELISNRQEHTILASIALIVWLVTLYLLSMKVVDKSIKSLGGAKI